MLLRSSAIALTAATFFCASACASAPPPAASSTPGAPATVSAPAAAPTTPTTAPAPSPPPSAATPKPALDAARIAAATGGKPETTDNVVKVSFPREERVDIAGWTKVPAFMGLTSWAAFVPGEKPGVEAMVMGDFVLFEDEVSAAMSAALDNGVAVTALHNHFFFDKPHVYFMHIGGEGSVEQLGKGVKAMLDAQHAIRGAKSAPVAASFGGALPTGASKIDGAKLDAVFGVKGASKDGMYKATMGRKAQAACGCTVGKAMGVNTWAAFGGTDEAAVVDGDFAVAESELQPVLKTLRSGGIHVVAIHSHMTGESPRILFLHYWGQGKSADLAAIVKRALDLTAWDGRAPSST
jgi:hypothetical protein